MTVGVVDGTQIMRRPDDYMSTPRTFATEKNPKVNVLQRRDAPTGRTSVGYFTNWGIYGVNFQPSDIVHSYLTHIMYAFAKVNTADSTIQLSDPFADEQKLYPGDNPNEPGTNLYGCLKQLYLLKMNQRNLKVSLSVGGYTYSQAGQFNFVTDPTSRANFVKSAVQMIQNYGLDGIDIDYEYAETDEQAQGFADLLTELRAAFDKLQSDMGESVPFQLSAAVSAGPTKSLLKVKQMDAALTYWNLMGFDYSGSWSKVADNQANVYGGQTSGVSSDQALQWYQSNGATPSKMNLGMPLYGRAFENTDGLGKPYNGVGPGTIDAGVYVYKTLPLAGATVTENLGEIWSYSYDSTKRELVSYDTPDIAKRKADYVAQKGLSGAMYWELSQDNVYPLSLVGTVSTAFSSLDETQNHISYPNSKWDNLRKNFGQTNVGGSAANFSTPNTSSFNSSDSSSSLSNTTASNYTLSNTNISNPSASGPPSLKRSADGCGAAAEWSANRTYSAGQEVSYNGHFWTAKVRSTRNETPGSGSSWADSGACTADTS